MSDFLSMIRAKVGPAPRRIPETDRAYFFARPPVWLPRSDHLRDYYRQQELLLTQGYVTWGALAYADPYAYEPGPCDVPATVVYVADATVAPDPAWLLRIAREYYVYRRDADLLKDFEPYEMPRGDNSALAVMGERLPPDLARGFPMRATGVMIRREHLPAGLMVGGQAPILAHPRADAVLIVPSRVWPAEYARQWRAELLGYPALSAIDDHVKLTPASVKIILQIMDEQGVDRDSYVYFWVPEPTNGFGKITLRLTFEPRMDPRRHLLSESLGMKIIIDRTQMDLLAGMVFGRNNPEDVE